MGIFSTRKTLFIVLVAICFASIVSLSQAEENKEKVAEVNVDAKQNPGDKQAANDAAKKVDELSKKKEEEQKEKAEPAAKAEETKPEEKQPPAHEEPAKAETKDHPQEKKDPNEPQRGKQEEPEMKTAKDHLKDIGEAAAHIGKHGEYEEPIKDSFDPYKDEHHNDMGHVDPNREDGQYHEDLDHEEIPLDRYDFDPSEGLSFVIVRGKKDCFYEEIKTDDDHVSGAYIVSSANPEIDVVISDPKGNIVHRDYSRQENDYDVANQELGVYEICFDNSRYGEDKLITHVMHTLQSQHPVEKEHVSRLSQYAEHLDVKLGELESEQRLLQLRTERHIKTEESTSSRVSFYTTIECITYIGVSVLQVIYIKQLLDKPRPMQRSWA